MNNTEICLYRADKWVMPWIHESVHLVMVLKANTTAFSGLHDTAKKSAIIYFHKKMLIAWFCAISVHVDNLSLY